MINAPCKFRGPQTETNRKWIKPIIETNILPSLHHRYPIRRSPNRLEILRPSPHLHLCVHLSIFALLGSRVSLYTYPHLNPHPLSPPKKCSVCYHCASQENPVVSNSRPWLGDHLGIMRLQKRLGQPEH